MTRAIQFASSEQRWPVYLFGATGVGKTFSAAAVYVRWSTPAIWYSLTSMCDLLRGFTISPMQLVDSSGQQIEVSLVGFWKRIEKAGLVVIDEIGTREATAHRYDALLRLLDSRAGRPLILTGNLDEESIAKAYDERILSRMAAGVMVNMKGRDQRMDGIEQRFRVVE